jgi:hypothetical protein
MRARRDRLLHVHGLHSKYLPCGRWGPGGTGPRER